MSEKIQQLLKTIEIYHISSNTFDLSNKVFPVLFVKNFVLLLFSIKIY